MLFHYTSWDGLDTSLRLGWIGVPLFFMISGFVILWSATGSTPPRFVASRVSRLYPSFWVCATLSALMKLDHVTLTQYLANMTFAHFLLKIDSINSVFWTLFVEIKFYAIVFALLSLGQMKNVEKWALAWLAASFVPALDLVTLGDFGALFLAGMFMFLIWRDGPSPLRLAATAVAAVAGTLQMSTEQVLANYSVPGQFVPAVLVLAACHAALFAIAMRWFRIDTSFYLLGSLTYPLYLDPRSARRPDLGHARCAAAGQAGRRVDRVPARLRRDRGVRRAPGLRRAPPAAEPLARPPRRGSPRRQPGSLAAPTAPTPGLE